MLVSFLNDTSIFDGANLVGNGYPFLFLLFKLKFEKNSSIYFVPKGFLEIEANWARLVFCIWYNGDLLFVNQTDHVRNFINEE